MRIDEMVRIQGSFEQRSKGKNKIGKEITDKSVIEALIGKIKGKKGKGKNKAEMPPISTTQANPAYNVSLSSHRTPMWEGLWTKREPAMPDEEIEKKMAELAIEFAEKFVEIGNSGKGTSMINRELNKLRYEYNDKQAELQLMYVSVVSPDRKAAYAKADFTTSNKVYGSESNIVGGNELMSWSPSGWGVWPTNAEMERLNKLTRVFGDTLKAYEAENGVKIPYTTIAEIVAPPRNYL